MEFYFIRHAQSTNNHLWDATRSDNGRTDDPELTALGKKQAARLAEHLCTGSPLGGCGGEGRGFGLTTLYTSLMVRAVETGSLAAQALGIPLLGWECLHECGGIYLEENPGERIGRPGKSRQFFRENYPALTVPTDMNPEGWWNRPFEDEELRRPRARQFLKDLLERHGGKDERVGVVSHGAFYNEIMNEILGRPERNNLWFAVHNTGITRIDFRGGETILMYQNRLEHLPPELIS